MTAYTLGSPDLRKTATALAFFSGEKSGETVASPAKILWMESGSKNLPSTLSLYPSSSHTWKEMVKGMSQTLLKLQ